MKKIFLSVFMSALFLIGSISLISMAPPPNTECSQFAEEFTEELGISKGEFMSLCNVCLNPSESAANQAVCVCKILNVFDEAPGSNFGQCVNIVKGGE